MTSLFPSAETDHDTPPSVLRIVEALLFVGGAPLTADRAVEAIRGATPGQFAEAIDELNRLYRAQQRPYRIQPREHGYEVALLPRYRTVSEKLYGTARSAAGPAGPGSLVSRGLSSTRHTAGGRKLARLGVRQPASAVGAARPHFGPAWRGWATRGQLWNDGAFSEGISTAQPRGFAAHSGFAADLTNELSRRRATPAQFVWAPRIA